MKKKSYILLGSPRELEERKEPNIGKFAFLLINVGGACNHRCFFCWTHKNTYPIKNKSFLNDAELTSLITVFHKLDGKSVAIMSDGEPLFSVNLNITKKVVELTGKFGMNMLLFTNGEFLTKEMIQELTKLNPKISFSVSLNATTKKTYEKIHGVKGSFDRVMKNFYAWKDFCKKTNKEIDNNKILTQFDTHFVVTETNLKEIPKIQNIADKLNCALVITSPGMSGRALLNVDDIAKDLKSLKFLEKTATNLSDTQGPTAKTYEQKCGYICSQHHFCSLYGITIHALGGMVQPCPYFLGIGSNDWFELKQYISNGGKDVKKWLVTSVKVISKVSDVLFDAFGYNYCLKRHPKYFEIEEFMDKLNKDMVNKTKDLKTSSPNYFKKLMRSLDVSLRDLSEEYKRHHLTNLDLIDRKIVYELDINARQTTNNIAKKINVSKPIIDYRLRRLIESGAIQKFYAVYDTSKLGYTTYKMFIKLQNVNIKKKEEIVEYIKNHPCVQFFITCDGSFDLVFNILANSVSELYNILKKVEDKYEEYIAEKELTTMVFSSFFFRNYLLGDPSEKRRKPMYFGSKSKITKIDLLDKKILWYLGIDARISIKEIAEKLGKNQNIISKRIEKLEKEGIIQNYITLPNTSLLDQISYKILFSIHKLTGKRENEFFQYCENQPNIWFHSKSLGEWDLEINMDVDNANQFRQIMMEIKSRFSDIIKEYNTLQVSKVHKFNFYPFKDFQ